MDRDPQVEGLEPASAGVAIGKTRTHVVQNALITADRASDDELARILERLTDLLTPGHFADAGVTRAVSWDQDVAREVRTVRAAQVHEHAVVAGNRNHAHRRDDRRAAGRRRIE
jgi:hypothetical protein